MKHLVRMTTDQRSSFNKNSAWFAIWGIALIVLGCLAVTYSTFSTLVSVVILGTLILAAGAVVVFDSFLFWWKKGSSFYLHLLVGILYLLVGGLLINNPISSSLSITLLLGLFYLFLGIFRLSYSFIFELPGHWWRMLNGLITLILGLLILASWPSSALFVIGLFVGIDLIFLGLAYTVAATTTLAKK